MPQFVARVGTLFEIRTQENDTRPKEYLREKGEKEHNIVWRRSSILQSHCGCNTDAAPAKILKNKTSPLPEGRSCVLPKQKSGDKIPLTAPGKIHLHFPSLPKFQPQNQQQDYSKYVPYCWRVLV